MTQQRTASVGMVPLVPGMLSTHHREMSRPDFRKRQILEQMSVGRATGLESAAIAAGAFASKLHELRSATRDAVPAPASAARVDSKRPLPPGGKGSSSSSTKFRVDSTQPAWVTNDRQVLRFFGYFQEKAVEAGREALRTRRVVLCYYLSDCALSISEPRVPNSGMAQGEFMKRTVATKPDGSYFTPQDLRVGGSVKLYGRTLHLVDCDEATRTYYDEALGMELEAPRRYPDDRSSHVDEIEEIKRRLRAKTAAVAESKAEATRKFHENGQKVLRFFVSWHDPHPLYPETRRYVLHYYLSDDTIEVVEPKEPPLHPQHHHQRERVGNHHFAVLISRRRVLKHDADAAGSGALIFGDHTHGKQLLTERDLRCGEWVRILSRAFLLEDCDPFTREYYLETHGVTQERCEAAGAGARATVSKWQLFHAQSDPRAVLSPAMLHRLDAHVQDNQARKPQDASLDKKQLRFRAKFRGLDAARDPNAKREFTLTYFLEDDTLAVFEPRMKNSGVVGGRFLDRGRFRKCQDAAQGDTSSRELQKDWSAYRAADFYVGAVVRFEFSPHQSLELLAADEQTLSYCESHSELFPFSNAHAVLECAAKTLSKSATHGSADAVRRECRAADRTNSRALGGTDFKRVLERCSVLSALNAQQVLTLCRKFAVSLDAQDSVGSASGVGTELPAVAYDDFCDALACHLTPATHTSKTNAHSSWQQQGPTDADGLAKLAKIPNLRKLLRQADAQSSNTVSGDAFLNIANFYRAGLSSSDLETLARRFSRNGAVEYHKLCDSVFQSPAPRNNPSSRDAAAPEHSPRRPDTGSAHDSDDGSDFDVNNDDAEQFCEPPSRDEDSLSARTHATPRLPLQTTSLLHQRSPALSAPTKSAIGSLQRAGASASSDSCVAAILRRKFGARKYQLRRALRERDSNKSGQLGEEEFMDALLSIEPALSDDDLYAIADAYFTTNNNGQVDYAQLLDSAFRV